MITRVRIEAKAQTEEQLRDDLASGVALFMENLAGDYHEIDDLQVQTTREGFWGFTVIRIDV